jgi:hypothetical protein
MPRPSTGGNLNIEELERILNTRRAEVNKLLRRRQTVQRRLDNIDRQIERVGGARAIDGRRSGGGGGSGSRARNEKSLAEVMEDVLRAAGKPMGVGEMVEAAQAAGYRSNSPSFRAIVNQTLIKERKRFASTGERGMYQLKK